MLAGSELFGEPASVTCRSISVVSGRKVTLRVTLAGPSHFLPGMLHIQQIAAIIGAGEI